MSSNNYKDFKALETSKKFNDIFNEVTSVNMQLDRIQVLLNTYADG